MGVVYEAEDLNLKRSKRSRILQKFKSLKRERTQDEKVQLH